jgi:hypothetical protein
MLNQLDVARHEIDHLLARIYAPNSQALLTAHGAPYGLSDLEEARVILGSESSFSGKMTNDLYRSHHFSDEVENEVHPKKIDENLNTMAINALNLLRERMNDGLPIKISLRYQKNFLKIPEASVKRQTIGLSSMLPSMIEAQELRLQQGLATSPLFGSVRPPTAKDQAWGDT